MKIGMSQVLWMVCQCVNNVEMVYLGSTIFNDGGIDSTIKSELQKQQMSLVVSRSLFSLTIAYYCC